MVEIDDRSHLSQNTSIERDKIKDKYCIDNQLKLLRIDTSIEDENEFMEALNKIRDDDIYVLRCGRLYQNYHGSKDIF